MRAKHERVDKKNIRDEIESSIIEATTTQVIDRQQKSWKDHPPSPLNLQFCQKKFPGSPSQVLSNLQSLYDDGHITYPRSSNQQYDDDFDFQEILSSIDWLVDIDEVDPSDPTRGDDFDSGHPPITPTTRVPDLTELGKWKKMTYIRVARHFVATLMDPAIKQKITYTFSIDDHDFESEIYQMRQMGYFDVYGAYKRVYDDEDPEWKMNQSLDITDWEIDERTTDPPDLWSPSSIVDRMDDRGLGTDATRHSMIDKIQDRSYAANQEGLRSTEFGRRIIDALREHAPRVTDSEFTRSLQEDLDQIREGDMKTEEIIDRSRRWIGQVCIDIKKQEKEIGANICIIEEGCPRCGGDLWLRTSYWFYGCENYPDCEGTID